MVIDPYLSHSVEKAEGPGAARLFPIAAKPEQLTDIDVVLISHLHLDHCDPDTVLPLAGASAQAKFVGPYEVIEQLRAWEIPDSRLVLAEEKWLDLGSDLRVRPVPACHPDIERNNEGLLRYVGYVWEFAGRRFYHSGDTKPAQEILSCLSDLSPIDTVFLPVNEKNFFRDRVGIVGNMSVREAFAICSEIKCRKLIPMHWDMFALNSVYREEIAIVFEKMAPGFEMVFYPTQV